MTSISRFTRFRPAPISRETQLLFADDDVPTTVATKATDLDHDVARVQKAWDRYQRTRERLGVYGFLNAVAEVVAGWKRDGVTRRRCRRLLRRAGFDGDTNGKDPVAIIMACVAGPDAVHRRTRDNWGRALDLAARRAREGVSAGEFIQRRGGIGACVARREKKS